MTRWTLTGLWLELGLSTPITPGDPRARVQEALRQGDEHVLPADGGVLVTPERLRSWDDPTLRGLGAERFPGRLTVEEKGIAGARYQWVLTWDGVPGDVEGPWLRQGGRRWLLDATLAEVVRLSGEVAGRPRAEVFERIARLVRLSVADPRIVPTRRLLTRTILRADAVRLSVGTAADGSPTVTPHLVELGTGEGGGREVPLDPVTLRRAADQCLAQDDIVDLGDSRYLVLTAAAARNARLALAAPDAPAEVRERFVQNPQAFLPDEAAFDEKDYSARVIGVGEAPRRPPELRAERRDWADAGDGLLLQSAAGEVVVPAEKLEQLRGALQAARAHGAPTADWEGHAVPATPSAIDAVDRALREKTEAVREGAPPPRPRVLLIAENEVVLDWAPPPDARRRVASKTLPSLKVELQPHQVAGVRRLQAAWANGEPGTLLCDDMGLGKTLQALVFAAWAAGQLSDEARSDRNRREGPIDVPVAIVAPPSLLEGWVREMERRLAPTELRSLVWGQSEPLGGAGGRTVVPLARFLVSAGGRGTVLEHARVDLDALRKAAPDVLLIAYDTLRRLQFAVGQIRFGVLIADEAHEAKDPSSLRSRALRAMRYDFGLALTGTPIENGWRDLWTVADFAAPGRLGTLKDFSREYTPSGDVRDLGSRLAETLAPVLVRRTRGTVLGALPPCAFRTDERAMPPNQGLAYRAEVTAHARSSIGILGLLQQLARVSLHPRVRAELNSAEDATSWARESARTAALWDALERYRRERVGVLVFVRSKAMQETLQRALQLGFGLDHVGVLNGDVGMRERQRLVDRVEQTPGFRVLLVSPDVGGAGWNLQFATRAVLLERPYNPAVEAQMVARIHRMGQQHPVEVVAPIAVLEGVTTFDQVLRGLLEEKRELSESVLAPSAMGDDEIAVRFASLGDPLPESVAARPPPTPPRSGEPGLGANAAPGARLATTPPRVVSPEVPDPVPVQRAPLHSAWERLPAGAARDWLAGLSDEGHRTVMTHLAVHGGVTEPEVAALLGSASRARRFAGVLDDLLLGAPLRVRVEFANGIKRYVRDDR